MGRGGLGCNPSIILSRKVNSPPFGVSAGFGFVFGEVLVVGFGIWEWALLFIRSPPLTIDRSIVRGTLPKFLSKEEALAERAHEISKGLLAKGLLDQCSN